MIVKNWSRYRKRKLASLVAASQSANSVRGLTLIECLVAIAVIGISIGVTTPMIALSVATRTQSQRADQALQIAQAEVDRIKFVVANNDTYTVSAATVNPTTAKNATEFDNVLPPENIDNATYSATSNAPNAKAIDVDGDGVVDYAAQIFRTQGSTVGTTPIAFDLGVRIYTADAVTDKTQAELGVGQANIGFTSGEGQGGTRPLSVIYTTVMKGDAADSLCDYYNFINSVKGTVKASPTQC